MIKEKYFAIKFLLILMILPALITFAAGCGGGGGGSVSSQAVPDGGASAGPSLTVEGEIDGDSLGIDAALDASAVSRFELVVVDNAAYKTFREEFAAMAGSSDASVLYASQRSLDVNLIDKFKKSGATIHSAGGISKQGGKLGFTVNIPLLNSKPDCTLMVFDKETGGQMLSTSLGRLPDKNDPLFTNSAFVNVPQINNITLGNVVINTTTTAGAMFNIENNLCSNIGLLDTNSFMKNITNLLRGTGNITISNSNNNLCNSSIINNVITNAAGSNNIAQLGNAIKTINKAITSSNVPSDVKNTIVSNFNSRGNLISGTLNGFVNFISNPTVINNVPGLSSSINIGGTVINSRSTPELITKVQSNVAVIFVEPKIPSLSSVKAFPASVGNGENINIAFKSDMELADIPKVYICGRLANILKTSSLDYAAWVEAASSDSTFTFSIDSIIGANGKQGQAVSSTTDGSSVTILKTAVEVLAPMANPPAGDYEGSAAVELSTKTPGAEIYYTFSADKPPIYGTKYSTPIMLHNNLTSQPVISVIRAVAVLNGKTSTITTANYRILPKKTFTLPPSFVMPGGHYNRAFALEIFCPTPRAQIRYTLDGSLPSKTNGALYTAALNISKSVTVKAMTFGDGMVDSKIVSAIYEIGDDDLAPVAAPVISPVAGSYKSPQAVSILCATSGASIRYTLDGSMPAFSAGALYTAPFMLNKSAVVKVIAFKDKMADSDITAAAFNITGEISVEPPAGLSEIEPKRNGTAVNSDFGIIVAAASGLDIYASAGGANALKGTASVRAAANMAVMPVDISKLIEGETNEIKLKAVAAFGEVKGELSVLVEKDTVAPRRLKLSAASSNASEPSVAAIGDRIVISLTADEPVKNMAATMMGKPVTIRSIDESRWTVARYLDGSEFVVDFDFMITFTDLAGNSIAAPLTKKDINEGAPLIIKKGGADGAGFTISMKPDSGRLYLSAVPQGMEYCLNGGSNGGAAVWYSGEGAEVDLSAVSHGNFIYVRQKGDDSTVVNLGVILSAPVYGIDEANTPGHWAFDAASGAVVMSAPLGIEDFSLIPMLNESAMAIHVYTGAGALSGVELSEGFLAPILSGDIGRFQIPSHVRTIWNSGEFLSYYISSNNGTPEYTGDDLYTKPAAGAAIKPAPLNSTAAAGGNFIYDGRSNVLIFDNSGGFMSSVSVTASLNSGETELLAVSGTAAGTFISYKLPWQPVAGDVISVSFTHKDKSVSPASKFLVQGAPENLASGFGNFSVKALLGQIAVTNFDSARDGFTAFISTDGGASWKELGKITSSVGQNFDITMSASSKIKLAMRDKNGNFSLTQAAGVSPMAAPQNSETGAGAYKILGHLKKIEIDNSDGRLNGFNILYSTNGGQSWSSTEAVNKTGVSRLAMSEYVQAGDGVRIALLDWKTGNASFAASDYILKLAKNRSLNSVAGDFIVNATSKKISVNNSASALSGFKVFVNGAAAGIIGAGDNAFAYEPGSSDEVEVYYAEPGGNTWLAAASKPVLRPRNNKLADGDFFVDAFNGKITFKNSGGAVSGLTPLISTDGGLILKDIGPALTAGDKEFAFNINSGDKIAAVFMDSEGNTSAASEVYITAGPKLNSPVKMILAGDGGAGAKAGVIEESGKPAVTIRPGVTLKNGESIKVTLSNGGAVTISAKAVIDVIAPVFGGSTPGVTYEAGAAGNGSITTGSFNLNNPGGTPVSIIGTVEVAVVHSDILGNVSPVSKAYITADIAPSVWAAGYPSISAPAYFKLNAGLQTNEDGKIYLVCLKSAEAAPTAAQVKLGQNASDSAVASGMKAALDFTLDGGAIIHEFTGLANNTEYSVYAVAEDLYENLQAQPAVVKMKTLNNIAPVWASGYPKAAAPEFNILSASVKTNETGSVYLACLKSGLASLTAAQVKAGTDASGAALEAATKAVIAITAADSEAVHIFDGLESTVEYDIYAVAEDEYGESQANPTVVKIKTIDDLPPVWSSGYPQGQPTGYTSLRLSASVDKKSIVYAVCLSSNAPEPTVAQVIAGRNASDVELASNHKGTAEVAANTTGYINFANLGVGTPYDIYSAAVNEYGVAQTAVTKTRSNTIALVPPSVSSVETSTDGTKILVKFNKTLSSTLPAAPGGFTITLGTSYNDVVTGVALNADDKSIVELTLTKTIYSDISSIKIAYTRGDSGVRCVEGLELSNFSARAVTNKSNVAFPLAKFEIAAIGAQKTGVEFAITVTAKDAGGNTVSLYDSSVYDSATAIGLTNATTSISPTVTGNFTNGAWTGNVKISQAKTGDTITASKGAITTPAPPSFNVGLSPVSNVIISDNGSGKIVLNWTNPPDTQISGMDIDYSGFSSGSYLVGWLTPQTSFTTDLPASNAYKFTLNIKYTGGYSASTVASWYRGTSVLLLKDAAFSGNEMVLTPAAEAQNGIAMFENKVDVTKDFTVDFTFKIENPSDLTGADGIIFMATKYSPSEIQAMPSGQWINSYINNFLYVDFDTYRNDTFDLQAHSISIKYPANQKLALGTAGYLNCNEMVSAAYGSRRMATWNPGNTTTEFHGTRYVRINYTAATGVWKVYYSQSAIAGEGDVKITHTYKLENLPADNSKIELVDGKYLYLGVSGITGASWEKHSLTSLTISNP